MAAFLSKVFPRKKEKETNKRSSVSSLLEGKFEAVSPTVSPSAAKFEEATQKPKERGREKEKDKGKDKESGFGLFRPKSRPLSPAADARKSASDTPHLTLNLPVPKEERSRALGVVFEGDSESISTLPDNVIGERRLNPLETLLLVKACSSAIIANGGLETLGVMHPFWYSASPEAQRKLISLFILSLAPKSPISTLSPSPTSPLSSFDTELQYTRSPHDIAAVLRWALRHLRLEGESFGKANGQWGWYQTFAEAERAASFPLTAFSDALVPQLPPSHLQLLIATLDIVSSLAAHSEVNGISGSKLSKFFGLWLLSVKRSEQGDDWSSFYSRWERAGRILEHLFLAHIRDEAARKKVPLRLSDLVKGYPYHHRSPSADTIPSADDDLLPRPRVSTRQYDALYVRIDTQKLDAKSTKQKQHPLRLISDALKSELELVDSKYKDVWEAIRKAALANDEPEPILTHVDGYPSVSRIFADETIRILSFIPAESSNNVTPSVPTIRVPRPPRKRTSSLNSAAKANGNGNGKASSNGTVTGRSATSATSPGSPKDWMDFSTSGFGDSSLGKDFASTLLDKDLEVTTPRPVVERKSSKKRKASPGRSRRSSVDNPDPESVTRTTQQPAAPASYKSKSTVVNIVKLDEAFVDFWSDALLDPISSEWPNFVVAQLKALPGVEIDGKPMSWLVLEQRFVVPPPPPAPSESLPPSPPPPRRASSPRPSMRSELSARKSSTLAAAKKRLTFFSSSQTLTSLASKSESKPSARKKAKPTRIGEMGEILPDEPKADKPVSKEPAKVEEPKAAVPASGTKSTASAQPAAAPTENATHVETHKYTEIAQPAEIPKVVEPASDQAQEAVVPPTAPTAGPASPAPMSPLTPTADDFPAVPVVGGVLVAAAATAAVPDAIEPLHTEDAPTADKPVLEVPEQPPVPADVTPAATEAPAPEEAVLPPAPEPVVLTGETPGPQVALDTSEPAALAELSAKIDEVVAEAASSPEDEVPPASERTIEVVPLAAPEVPAEETPAQVEENTPASELVAPVEAAAPEPEPEPTVTEEPAEGVAPEPESAPVVEEAPLPTPKEPAVEATPVVEETPAVEETPVVPTRPVEEEPAAVPEPEQEVAAPTERAPEPAIAAPVGPEPGVVAPEKHEIPAAPEAVPEPAQEAEAASTPAPAPSVHEEEPSTTVPAVEEVKDEEGAVVEDVAAPDAEEVAVQPVVEEPVVQEPEYEPAKEEGSPALAPADEVTAAEPVPAAADSDEEPVAAPASVEEATPAPEPETVVESVPEAHASEEPAVEAAAEPASEPESAAVSEPQPQVKPEDKEAPAAVKETPVKEATPEPEAAPAQPAVSEQPAGAVEAEVPVAVEKAETADAPAAEAEATSSEKPAAAEE